MESVRALRIEKLVSGGDGLAFEDGRAVFVPRSVPGELLEVRTVLVARDFVRAEPVRIIEPSPDRVEPACPLFGVCGGCTMQHISAGAQARYKAAAAREAFVRTAGFDPGEPAVETGAAYGYRNRLQVHVTDDDGLGFQKAGESGGAVRAHGCPVAAAAADRWLASRNRLVRPARDLAAAYGARERFTVFAPGAAASPGAAGTPAPAGSSGAGHGAATGSARGGARIVATSGTSGVATGGASGGLPADGLYLEGRDAKARVRLAGEDYEFPLRHFFQSNVEMAGRLAQDAVAGLSGESAADLYCGAGLFGRLLARNFGKVFCVESDAVSLEAARANVPAGRARFFSEPVEQWVRRGNPAGGRIDWVLADPPRQGLSPEVRAWLCGADAGGFSYVSCDPVTLARDVGELVRSGWLLESLALYDFYPQTGRFEALARMRRRV